MVKEFTFKSTFLLSHMVPITFTLFEKIYSQVVTINCITVIILSILGYGGEFYKKLVKHFETIHIVFREILKQSLEF